MIYRLLMQYQARMTLIFNAAEIFLHARYLLDAALPAIFATTITVAVLATGRSLPPRVHDFEPRISRALHATLYECLTPLKRCHYLSNL